jgi:hypothetical protein
MTNGYESPDDEQELRSALQHALADRFDGVDWEDLRARILAAAAVRAPGEAPEPLTLVARWAKRGIPAAGALLAAGIAALLVVPPGTRPDAGAATGFWPVAEELMADVPEETRRLIDAGSDVESMLNLVLAHERTEDEPS